MRRRESGRTRAQSSLSISSRNLPLGAVCEIGLELRLVRWQISINR
jgi:hypothetical protein